MRTSLLAVAAFATQATAQPAIFVHLGAESQANDVSADGQLVVGSRAVNGVQHIFRWTASQGFTMLGPGRVPRTSDSGNEMTWIEGGVSVKRWSHTAGASTIGTIIPNANMAGISGDGQTVVFGDKRWNSETGTTSLLGPTGAGTGVSFARGVSQDGSFAVGAYAVYQGPSYGARWNAGGQATSLGTIPGYPLDASANVVSDDGSIVYGIATGPGGLDTFRWTAATGMVALGAAAAGFVIPQPADVTGDGSIMVGTAAGTAFVWRQGSGPENLKVVLETQYGLDLGSYSLDQVSGVSDDGRTLVGFGNDWNNPFRFGWVVHLPWSIPAPGSALVLCLMGLCTGRRRRLDQVPCLEA